MIQVLKNLWNQLLELLVPDRYYSWQVMIYLSLFSWAMSWLGWLLDITALSLFVLTSFSWIFLAIGIAWALEAAKIRLFGVAIAPWVTGAILCAFVFGNWSPQLSVVLISWPLISFLVIAVPKFFTWELKWSPPEPSMRQHLILLLLLSVIFSSWFGFYFRIQSWLADYPSLLAESFTASRFVYRVPVERPTLSEGVSLLSLAESVLQEEIDNRPWPTVERWLRNLDDQVAQVRLEIRDRLEEPTLEHRFWQVEIQPATEGNGYDLQLLAIWHGPAASPDSYYQEKVCRIRPVQRPVDEEPEFNPDDPLTTDDPPPMTTWSSFDCDLTIPRRSGSPALTLAPNPVAFR